MHQARFELFILIWSFYISVNDIVFES